MQSKCKGYSKLWFIALLLAVFMFGCGGSGTGQWSGVGGG